MSKSVKRLKALKNVADKIEHSKWMKTNILAGMASAAPPLGSMLGQRSINIAAFCKDFNERTANHKKGIPLPSRVQLNPDRTYTLIICQPPSAFFLMQAAGISRGKMGKGTVGKITVKHLYEIAKIKSQDPALEDRSLQSICKSLIGVARTCGIEVVHKLDAEEYGQFLAEKKIIVDEQLKEIMEKKEAKMLRTA